MSNAKTLLYSLRSKAVSLDTQLIESCGSVLRELYFAIDDEIQYDLLREDFCQKLKNKGADIISLKEYFPNYKQLTEKYSEV
jgi:hypothetical protein